MSADRVRSLVLDRECGAWRRRLGPGAWMVLEELVSVGEGGNGSLTASVSVRMLARRLGLSKDTVNRAVRRLECAGLVVPGPVDRGDRGRFTAASYRVEISRLPMRPYPEHTATRSPAGAGRDPTAPGQLALFDAGSTPMTTHRPLGNVGPEQHTSAGGSPRPLAGSGGTS